MRFSTLVGTGVSVCIFAAAAQAGRYSDAVDALQPDHYYRLDETVPGTVADTGKHPAPAVHEGTPEVGVPGPDLPGFDSTNRALNDANLGGVRLGAGTAFAADTMSIAMWFLAPGGVQVGDRLFTNNVERHDGGTADSFQIVMPNGATPWSIAIATGNDDPPVGHMQKGVPIDNAIGHINVQDNQWHHAVIVRNGDDADKLTVVIDGVDYSSVLQDTSAGWGFTGSNAHLGVRADEGASDHNHNGSIDDTAIWLNRALTVPEAQALYNAAVPEPTCLGLVSVCGMFFALRRRR